jgi:SNF2 family DNA or RNA helicase
MIPCGREFTIKFSPTRRHLSKVDKKTCVLCRQGSRPSVPTEPKGQNRVKTDHKESMKDGNGQEKASRNRVATDLDLDNEVLDDSEFDDATGLPEDEEDVVEDLPLVALECCKKAFGVQHYAHEACIPTIGDVMCPRCQDGRNRSMLNFGPAFNSSGFQSPIYCKEILGGFKGSSKINEVVDAVMDTNPDDKILVLSFFKSSLDLLEGIFTYDLKFGCARFDGDLPSKIASEQLENFKKNASIRILLATVQSGGTGLNIVEANHVFFVSSLLLSYLQPETFSSSQCRSVPLPNHWSKIQMDRWYNPFGKIVLTRKLSFGP